MPSKSSSVSVGRPIIKYSLILLQPLPKAMRATLSRLASSTPLLITSRRRWVPASGAKVKPVFFPFCISLARFMEKLSTRSDGSETLIFFGAISAIKLRSKISTLV